MNATQTVHSFSRFSQVRPRALFKRSYCSRLRIRHFRAISRDNPKFFKISTSSKTEISCPFPLHVMDQSTGGNSENIPSNSNQTSYFDDPLFLHPYLKQTDVKRHDPYFLGKNFEKVNKTLSLQNGCYDDYPTDEHGLVKLEDTKLTQKVLESLDDYQKIYGKEIKKYILLGATYTILSRVHLNNIEHARQLSVAVSSCHISHWILNDLIDNYRNEVNNTSLYAQKLIHLYFSTSEQQSKIFKNKLRLVITQDAYQDIITRCEIAKNLLNEGMGILEYHFSPDPLIRVKKTYKEAIYSFHKKIILTSKEKSLTNYIESRQITAGCIPYMNIGYIIGCLERNIDPYSLMDFINIHENDIDSIEKKANLCSGIFNDMFSVIKDLDEDTSNIVYILGNGNNPENLYTGLLETITYIRKLYNEIINDLSELEEKSQDVQKSEYCKNYKKCYSLSVLYNFYVFFICSTI